MTVRRTDSARRSHVWSITEALSSARPTNRRSAADEGSGLARQYGRHRARRFPLSGPPELTGVQKMWFSDWYDGPLTGVARYEGREYWFVMVTNDDSGHWGSSGMAALAAVHHFRYFERPDDGGFTRSLAA